HLLVKGNSTEISKSLSQLPDKEFARCFFMSYRSFLSPSELLSSFATAYKVSKDAKPPQGQKFSVWIHSLQAHVRLLFKQWVTDYPEDLKPILPQVKEFMQEWRPKLRTEML